ncbi:hypothetical protein M409DRAFT_30787 [Zasmidium cellare ATCC 36951]|uniref:Uncharacterized protein n=1 Tax=Zasmidium cellare ATCC 36951 TaxID=1080233 RepID=A0A6A6BVI2_ZASCE|nr:uncharacterized protein M409DRAFT_30787 [Zasmidium cellare ATCC 36951]KAF2158695.1 hypothetical protein M409DRAFT_30787 [Zasmidium cellare ATCC 36951]
MTRNYAVAAPPNRPPRDPQPRDDGMHRNINNMNMNMVFARMNLNDPHQLQPAPMGGRIMALDPNPRDPGNGRIADPNPRDPGNGRQFMRGPQPRDPGTGRQFAMGPQPRDDGKSRTRRFARDPQPRDPGN